MLKRKQGENHVRIKNNIQMLVKRRSFKTKIIVSVFSSVLCL